VTQRPGPIYLGWQFAPAAIDPGAPPARAPAALPVAAFDQGWAAAQRRIDRELARPARFGVLACSLAAAAIGACWLAGLAGVALAGSGVAVTLAGGLGCARSVRHGKRQLDAVLTAERQRVDAAHLAHARRLAGSHRDHASKYRAWQRRKAVFDRQPSWYAVRLPAGIDRLDVAGGTLAGWSALVTTIAATHLRLRGEVTIVDLTEGAIAGDLAHLAWQAGLKPLVWVLPADLPRFDLGPGFAPPVLADVLALAAGANGQAGQGADRGGADYATDCALLERLLGALGPGQGIATLTAGLRVLGEIGDPRTDLRAGLITADQLDRVGTLFGRGGTERVVLERAWALESRLRGLDPLGTDQVPLSPSRLRVAALDRHAGVIGNRTLGTYLVAALTQMLRQTEAGQPWQHTLCLFGAERLGGELIDRLTDACEVSRTGLVLGYRSIQPVARERLGRGNAAIAFMRLGNGDDARAASDLIGTEHRFLVGQITDTVGTSVTDTWGDSYTSTVGTADSVSDSRSFSASRGRSSGRGRSYQGGFAPFGDIGRSASGDRNYSTSEQDSVSLTKGINSGTSWGLSLSRAIGDNASLGRTAQRSREFLVEAAELQRLPPSAAIITYPAAAGRTVLLADTNPAIINLPAATTRGDADSDADSDADADSEAGGPPGYAAPGET
jgi:hypothetical protein